MGVQTALLAEPAGENRETQISQLKWDQAL